MATYKTIFSKTMDTCVNPEGGTGVPDPPEKSPKHRVSGQDPLKSQSYQASIPFIVLFGSFPPPPPPPHNLLGSTHGTYYYKGAGDKLDPSQAAMMIWVCSFFLFIKSEGTNHKSHLLLSSAETFQLPLGQRV